MKTGREVAGAGMAALLLGGTLAGCRPQDAAPALPPQVVRVQIAPLAARHPLAAEVVRLQQAENAFARLAQNRQVSAGQDAALPALPRLGPVRTDPNLGGRRQRERERLQRTAARGLARYAQEREARRQSLQEQRRIELTAALRARDADAERQARLGVQQEVARKIALLSQQRLDLEAALALLNGQLSETTLTVGPSDPKDLEAEIARLEADPKAEKISPRARVERRRRRFQAQLDALLKEIAGIELSGQREIAQLAARAETERNRQIAAQLQDLQQDDTLARLQNEQQVALRKVLAAETVGAQLERQVMQTAGRADSGNAPLGLASLQGTTSAPSPTLANAVRQIRTQRERLSQFIEESVAEAVRDTAHQHNLTVALVRDAGGTLAGAQPAGAEKAADRTADFMRWIRWGEPLPPTGH